MLVNNYGASWYGGFILVTSIVVLISNIFYGKTERIKFLKYHAMLVSLAYSLGRQACFVSADGCYGIPTNSIFGMRFLHGIKPTLLTVYPTPLFESIISFILFL
ncbi:MAG: prolipoprotein diacylglyceryl transferase, partial [Bacteroidales bacterium]